MCWCFFLYQHHVQVECWFFYTSVALELTVLVLWRPYQQHNCTCCLPVFCRTCRPVKLDAYFWRFFWRQKHQCCIFPRQSSFSYSRPSVGQRSDLIDILMFLQDQHTVPVGACCADTLSSCLIHFIKEVLRVAQCDTENPSTSSTVRGTCCVLVLSVHSSRAFLFFFCLFYSNCENNLVMCIPSCYETFKLCFLSGFFSVAGWPCSCADMTSEPLRF